MKEYWILSKVKMLLRFSSFILLTGLIASIDMHILSHPCKNLPNFYFCSLEEFALVESAMKPSDRDFALIDFFVTDPNSLFLIDL